VNATHHFRPWHRPSNLTLELAPRFTVIVEMGTTISAIARQAGVSPDTLRYYERLGLVAPAQRMANGYRRYDPDVVDRVRLIKGAQRTGLRLGDIKELLEISDRGACPCGHTRTLLEQRIGDVTASSIGCASSAASSPTCSPGSTAALSSSPAAGGARPSSLPRR
jgi:DNA-binding transcriptional MerR regulator